LSGVEVEPTNHWKRASGQGAGGSAFFGQTLAALPTTSDMDRAAGRPWAAGVRRSQPASRRPFWALWIELLRIIHTEQTDQETFGAVSAGGPAKTLVLRDDRARVAGIWGMAAGWGAFPAARQRRVRLKAANETAQVALETRRNRRRRAEVLSDQDQLSTGIACA
jgi:hypothetical protein